MDEESQDGNQSVESLKYLLRRSLVARNKQTLIVHESDGRTTFCCVECPMKYSDKESMELHLCMHNKEYRFICTVCGTGLKRKEHLERHTLGHQEVRPHTCQVCGKAFKRKEHLNIHRAIHSGERHLQCNMCERTFHRKDHLQKHLQSHNNKYRKLTVPKDEHEVQEIKCEVPDYDEGESDYNIASVCETFVEQETLPSRRNRNGTDATSFVPSSNPERPFGCPLCPKTYKRKDHLKLHSAVHNKKYKVCSDCGMAFPKEEQLMLHMNEHIQFPTSLLEGNEEDHPNMEIMDQETWQNIDVGGLLVPRERPSEARPHACPVCHKRFKRKQHLAVHSNVHRKPDLSIWCSLCNEGFHSNQQFESHECMMMNLEGNSENIDELQMQNNILTPADQEYAEKDQLISQQQLVEPEIQIQEDASIPVPQKVFVCKFCSKPFRRRDHYKIHLNIHTGFKSFFCPDCGKGFYRKDHLQKHLPVHTRGKVVKKEIPKLLPIKQFKKPDVFNILPEITIHAPSNSKLRLPLQMRVPYEVVTSTEEGEQRSVVHPQSLPGN